MNTFGILGANLRDQCSFCHEDLKGNIIAQTITLVCNLSEIHNWKLQEIS